MGSLSLNVKMLSRTVVVTGASRGLGLELVKQLVKNPEKHPNRNPSHVVATCRNPDNAPELMELAAEEKDRLFVKALDVLNYESFNDFVNNEVKSVVGGEGVSCLINNAGVSGQSLDVERVNIDSMLETFKTNTIAPLMLTKSFVPLLKIGAQKDIRNGALVVNMSSILGSVRLNHPRMSQGYGGAYPYRCSKAALNMVTRSLCLDLFHLNIKTMAMHPGWVNTDMGGMNATLSPENSIAGVLDVIATFDHDLYNGNLVDYKGQIMPS